MVIRINIELIPWCDIVYRLIIDIHIGTQKGNWFSAGPVDSYLFVLQVYF